MAVQRVNKSPVISWSLLLNYMFLLGISRLFITVVGLLCGPNLITSQTILLLAFVLLVLHRGLGIFNRPLSQIELFLQYFFQQPIFRSLDLKLSDWVTRRQAFSLVFMVLLNWVAKPIALWFYVTVQYQEIHTGMAVLGVLMFGLWRNHTRLIGPTSVFFPSILLARKLVQD